jgi:Sulfotransferase family
VRIERPLIILGAPRSGTTLLFSILSSHPRLWSFYTESEPIIRKYFRLGELGWERGNTLGAEDVSEEIAREIRKDFYQQAQNYQALFKNTGSKVLANPLREKIVRHVNKAFITPLLKPETIRIVEKTAKNCVRVSFLSKVFPDALFVFLVRDPRTNISSLMEGWKEKGKYHTYWVPGGLEIDGYGTGPWNFFLPPGWQDYAGGKRLAEVCAFQYRIANEAILEGLGSVSEERKVTVRYEDLLATPQKEIERVCKATNLSYRGGLQTMTEQLPSVNSSTRPHRDKWRKNEQQVLSVIDMVDGIAARMGYTL